MSGLYSSLNNTVKALSAHSRALETAGKNLANVNNPSYARQRIIYGDRGSVQTPQGTESLGLEALGIQQMRDALTDQQVVREISLTAAYSAEQSGYQRAQAGLGQGIDRATSASDTTSAGAKGIGGALDGLFNAFSSFSASPTDFGERQALIQKAQILGDRLRLADQRLAQVQSDLDTGIGTDVDDANRLLADIAELNKQIGGFESIAPGSAVDLRDQRQAKLELLAAKIPIQVRPGTGGQIQVVALDASGADIPLITQSTVQGTVAFTGTAITAGSPVATLALGSGSIRGALNARDNGVQTLRDNLDALARQLVTSVNAAYNPSATVGGNFFTATGLTAGTFNVDPAVTVSNLKASNGGPAGDNTVALAVAQLAHRPFSTAGGDLINGTFGNFFSQTVSRLGQSLASANARAEDQAGIEKLIRTQRDTVSGVSLDEEMADLMKFQRAFQASSRVFSVIDQLLDNVVNQLGR